ncbi:hypothetical protein OQA88_7192 [Cercophora sp. LCS_1]
MPSDQTGNSVDASATDNSQHVAAIAPDVGDIEEGRDAYHPGGLHPVYISDVFADKYEVLKKIGYGRHSTVWLVKDRSKPTDDEQHFMALKILSADSYNSDQPVFEREILTHLRATANSKKILGRKYVCHLVDDFEHQGPNGTHVCLLFELMGETLRSFGAGFPEDMVPTPIMRKFTFQLICALDFAHESGVIHTDIKPDNIFVKFRDRSQIASYLADYPAPGQDRNEARYTPIESHHFKGYYLGSEPWTLAKFMELDIALGDWGVSSWADKHPTENIQPVALRAPEVLIKAPWDKSADWWNLGAVVYEVYRAIRLFSGEAPPDGHYELKEHLAEIVDVFGPFPKELLDKGDPDIVREMFDDEGKIKDSEPFGRQPLESEVFLPGLDQEVRESFGSLLRGMMNLNPAERPTAEDLVKHPWIGVKLS